ncbi:MAG: hypothetical protein IPK97_11175 [Ahniella sp.]|nr:hypothetical protein [Ahniella sp.]
MFLASCISLLTLQGFVSALLESYSPSYPSSFGPRLPAFSSYALALMSHSAAVCIGAVVSSVLLALLVCRREMTGDNRLYWLTVLAGINFLVSSYVATIILIGFFLLPKAANAI